MADRGRKAFPVSSHVCADKWNRHCYDLHRDRLDRMKPMVDDSKPDTFGMKLSGAKKDQLQLERKIEIDRENGILWNKMVKIRDTDSRAIFRPWLGRTTFQWKAGLYYDPNTGTKCQDHINLTSAVSPCSINYALTRPGSAPGPDFYQQQQDFRIQHENTKLLRAISTAKSKYDMQEFERKHMEETVLIRRISNYRGPQRARYAASCRGGPSTPNHLRPGSPYLANSVRASTAPAAPSSQYAGLEPWTMRDDYTSEIRRDLHSRGGSRYRAPPRSAPHGIASLDGFSPPLSASMGLDNGPLVNGHLDNGPLDDGMGGDGMGDGMDDGMEDRMVMHEEMMDHFPPPPPHHNHGLSIIVPQ